MSMDVRLCKNPYHLHELYISPQLHPNNPNWIIPVRIVTAHILSKANSFYNNDEMNFDIACYYSKLVKRTANIINHLHDLYSAARNKRIKLMNKTYNMDKI